jgi:hypothetical protein
MERLHAVDDNEVQLGEVSVWINARKKYAGQPVGEYWIALARKVIVDQSKRSPEPERTSAIQ